MVKQFLRLAGVAMAALCVVALPVSALADGIGVNTGTTVILQNGWTGSFNSWGVGGSSTFTSIVENTQTGQIYPVTSTSTITATGSNYTAGVTTTAGENPQFWCWGSGCDGNLPPPSPPPPPPAPPPSPSSTSSSSTTSGSAPPSYTPQPQQTYTPPISWSVSLSASAARVQTGSDVTLTATASANVGPTPYWLVIESAGGSILAECGAGTTCATSQSAGSPTTTVYTALVADYSGSNVQARSVPVSVTWFNPTPAPTVSAPVFSPDPAYPGQQVCASVQATNATSVSLSQPGSGDLGLTGSGNTWTGCFSAPGPGGYALTATAEGPGGSGSASGTLTVRATVPTAAFSVSPNPIIAGWQAVTYTDQSSGGGYGASIASEHWSVTGPGGSWSGPSPSALPTSFTVPGQYAVTLAVTNNYGASASAAHTLTVLPAPTLAITVTPSLAQPGQTVTVSAAWEGWTSASINVSAFGAGTWPQAGSGTWSRPFVLTSSGSYSACITGTLNGQTRQACAATTVLAPTVPVLTQ